MLFFSIAHAADAWSDVAAGVKLLHRTTADPMEIWALEVDLCTGGVELRATAVDERGQTVSDFGEDVGATAAINGDFFSYDNYYPVGIGLSGSDLWNDDTSSEGFYVFGADTTFFSPPSEVWTSLEPGMEEAVGGRPQLVDEGALTYDYDEPDHCASANPRTAMGLSRDGQTLWLVVVDGRTSASDGMTCEALAELMQGLGAWTALNLDGGGSSALWTDAGGVQNEPSDGSERVVANHLAVLAGGTGPPASCDMREAELTWDAAVVDDGPTDVDADGRPDLCVRAAAGLRCYPATGAGFGDPLTTTKFSDDNGWGDPANYATLRFPDLDGDGRTDVCGRGDGAVYCALSTGTGWGDTITGPALSDTDGWDDPAQGNTLRFGDIDADGDADLCARDTDGMSCWPWTGGGFGDEQDGPTLSDASGWGAAKYHQTLRMGDVTGDGRADLCARAAAGMKCWIAPDFTSTIDGPVWSDALGWDGIAYRSTVRLVDLEPDGRMDLCGRGPDGIECARAIDGGFGATFAGPTLSDASGWDDPDNYSTLRWADVDGDRDADVCARADARVYCWLQDGDGFATRVDGPELSDDNGWEDPHYYSTIRLADIDGDARADLCARGADGVHCWIDGFATEIAGPSLTDGVGWYGREYLTTLRLGGVPVVAEVDTGEDSGEDSGADSGVDSGADTGVDSGGDSATDTATSGPPGRIVDAEGCGCGTSGAPSGAVSALGMVAGLALRRRRPLSSFWQQALKR